MLAAITPVHRLVKLLNQLGCRGRLGIVLGPTGQAHR
jgi:hypothetical protein